MYQQKPNEDLRLLARRYGVAAWEVAEVLHISPSTYFYRLRKQLSPEQKKEIEKAIADCGTRGGDLNGEK